MRAKPTRASQRYGLTHCHPSLTATPTRNSIRRISLNPGGLLVPVQLHALLRIPFGGLSPRDRHLSSGPHVGSRAAAACVGAVASAASGAKNQCSRPPAFIRHLSRSGGPHATRSDTGVGPWTSTPTLMSPKPPRCAQAPIPERTMLKSRPVPPHPRCRAGCVSGGSSDSRGDSTPRVWSVACRSARLPPDQFHVAAVPSAPSPARLFFLALGAVRLAGRSVRPTL
jgi:hypothetical protein